MKERLDTKLFITSFCMLIKGKKNELGLNNDEMMTMTGLTLYAILNIENGTSNNMVAILEYARAVGIDLVSLKSSGYSLEPLRELEKDNSEGIQLTFLMRKHIIKTDYLGAGKVVADIRKELLSKKVIDEHVTSTKIAGVMRSLLRDGTVKNISKSEGKNVYVLFE